LPRFKRKHAQQSSYHCTGKIAIGDDWITIPKLSGRISAVVHRVTSGKLRSITLTKTRTGKYFAACLFEDETKPPVPPHVVRDVIGVDVGLAHVAIDSTGRARQPTRSSSRGRSAICLASRRR